MARLIRKKSSELEAQKNNSVRYIFVIFGFMANAGSLRYSQGFFDKVLKSDWLSTSLISALLIHYYFITPEAVTGSLSWGVLPRPSKRQKPRSFRDKFTRFVRIFGCKKDFRDFFQKSNFFPELGLMID